jgi:hypothetical protein
MSRLSVQAWVFVWRRPIVGHIVVASLVVQGSVTPGPLVVMSPTQNLEIRRIIAATIPPALFVMHINTGGRTPGLRAVWVGLQNL